MKRLLALCAVFLVVLGSMTVWLMAGGSEPNTATKPVVYDPGQKGPYEVGFKYYKLTDPSRNTDIGGRPIAVFLWYPVDQGDISAESQEAIYPFAFDPAMSFLEPFTSTEWENQGVDRAYRDVPASSNRPFPLVMFSAGLGCVSWDYTYFGTRLASHGFVVANLTHYGETGLFAETSFDHIAVVSMNRPRDVSFALTSLLDKNNTQGDLLFNLLKPDQVAASGHSLGGYAAMVLAAGDDRVIDFFNDPSSIASFGPPPPETDVPSLPDRRFKVILPLDGSNQVLKFSELARVSIPAMGIGEEWGTLAQQQAADPTAPEWMTIWQARQHAAYSGHPAYRVDVNAAFHGSFTTDFEYFGIIRDRGWIDETTYQTIIQLYFPTTLAQPEIERLTTKYMVAFLKTHLSGQTGYQNILTPGYALTREHNIEFFVTEKRNPNATDENWPGLFTYFPHQPGSLQEQAEKDPQGLMPIPRSKVRDFLR